jgi:hypothetical protein
MGKIAPGIPDILNTVTDHTSHAVGMVRTECSRERRVDKARSILIRRFLVELRHAFGCQGVHETFHTLQIGRLQVLSNLGNGLGSTRKVVEDCEFFANMC